MHFALRSANTPFIRKQVRTIDYSDGVDTMAVRSDQPPFTLWSLQDRVLGIDATESTRDYDETAACWRSGATYEL